MWACELTFFLYAQKAAQGCACLMRIFHNTTLSYVGVNSIKLYKILGLKHIYTMVNNGNNPFYPIHKQKKSQKQAKVGSNFEVKIY